MRRLRMLFIALALALMLPSRAYASTLLNTYPNGYDADDVATTYLGYETYMHLDQGLKTVIHNSTVGGGNGTTSNPNYPYYAAFRNSLSQAISAGAYAAPAWYSSYNGFGFADAVDKARADLAKAFRWWEANKDGIENSPTDEPPAVDGDYTLIPLSSWAPNPPSHLVGLHTLAVKTSTYQAIANWAAQHNSTLYAWVTNDRALVGAIGYGTIIWDDSGNSLGRPYVTVIEVTGTSNAFDWCNSFGGYNVIDGVAYQNTNMSSGTSGVSGKYHVDGNYPIYFRNTNVLGGGGSGEPYEPVEPDPLPPKNPDTPSDPVVPDPPENTDPVPSPGIDWGDTIVTNINVTQTDPDYQPIINAISVVNQTLQQTQNLILALQNNMKIGFEELDSQIYNNFQALLGQNDAWWNWLHDAWESLYGQLDEWGNWLNTTLEGMREDFSSFESNLVTWLQMIYDKISSAGRSIPDPVTDDDDYFDWFKYIINLILEKLGLLDSLTDFANLFAQLRTVFPFSVPWDVAAILGLFAHDPVAPVFDVPYPANVNGDWTMQRLSLNLAPWDSVAQLCRTFIKILFAYYLALWTREGLKNFEVSTDD